MPVPNESLGGRLELLDPATLSVAQQEVYNRISRTMVPWAEEAGFQSTTGDGRLVGPFNPVLLSPGIAQGFLSLQEAEQAHTSLDERVRQVVILTVGAACRSEYELYAHAAVGRKAGLSEEAIRTLMAGELPEELEGKEKIAQRYVWQLSTRHRVDASLYNAAADAFGTQGLVDIAFLAGIYHIVCALLNGFEIPAPAPGHIGADADRSAPPANSAPHDAAPPATLAVVASFPPGHFLENLVVREDNSLLVTSVNHKQLWYVPPMRGATPVEPSLLHEFERPTTGVVQIEPDVFLVSTSNLYTTHECTLHRLDLRGWTPGSPIQAETVFRFPEAARGLNGSCLVAPGVVLVADCFAGLIWRVDLPEGGGTPSARVWLEHDSMGYYPGTQTPEQPGVNGVRYAARTRHLYYTATAKKLFMRVPVDPVTFEPAGGPELVVAGRMGDDFCIDEDAGVIYLTTHRQNTIDRVSMDPGKNSGFTQSVAGDPFDEALIGPSSGAWGRGPGEYGRVAFFTTDGGTASPPPDGVRRPAKLLRVEFQRP